MFINALVFMIKDALPLLVLYAYLSSFIFMSAQSCAQKSSHSSQKDSPQCSPYPAAQKLFISCILCLVLGVLLGYQRPLLDATWQGTGYEYMLIISNIIVVLSLLRYVSKPNSLVPAILSLGILTIIETSNIVLFIEGVLHSEQLMSAFSGMALGLGVTASIAYLLFSIFSAGRGPHALFVAISLFCAGLLASNVNVAQQIDLLTSSLALWDSNQWLLERGEIAQLLKVLIGYEATPSGAYAFAYLSALLGSLLWLFVCYYTSKTSSLNASALVDTKERS